MSNPSVTAPTEKDVPTIQAVISVLWPSFILSGLATILFFTLFDPVELSRIAGGPEISRLGGYSIGFFSFWLLTALACSLTCYFRRPCHQPKS